MKVENSNDTSGTPGYMGKLTFNWIDNKLAPEVMCRQNHSFAVDYFVLGVIAYEFMLGRVNISSFQSSFSDLILEDQDRK